MEYGLRFFEHGGEVRLMQSSGGGRILVSSGTRSWWIDRKMLKDKTWEVYEADEGQRYDTREVAEQVAINLRT